MSEERQGEDCSGPISQIQVYLAGLAWLEPDEGWGLAHPVLRQFVPEYDDFGWYALDYADLIALADCLKGIYQQSVSQYVGQKMPHKRV